MRYDILIEPEDVKYLAVEISREKPSDIICQAVSCI